MEILDAGASIIVARESAAGGESEGSACSLPRSSDKGERAKVSRKMSSKVCLHFFFFFLQLLQSSSPDDSASPARRGRCGRCCFDIHGAV